MKILTQSKTIYIILLTLMITACQNASKQSVQESKIPAALNQDPELIKVLSEQLKKGDDEKFKYTEKDLDVTVPVLKEELLKYGFKPVTDEVFAERIGKIFGRKIDPASSSRYLAIHFDPAPNTERYASPACNKELVFKGSRLGDSNPVYVIKNGNFITELFALPRIIDYKTKYPELSSLESKDPKMSPWKDDANLVADRKKIIERFAIRNIYLINEDKSRLPWLIKNDPAFLEDLVTDFGYTADPKLLEWLMKRSLALRWPEEILGEILWRIGCNGELIFHEAAFEVLNSLSSKENSSYLENLSLHISNIDLKKEHRSFDLEKRTKLLTYLCYQGTKIAKEKGSDYGYSFFPTLNKPAYIAEMKKHNFYGLPGCEALFEDIKTAGTSFYFAP
ncbi:hypothetical protein H9X96_20325 [Pedobacter sp. N36a]|uniref:hypothetical protein n=1 Tax=Pedobacter sp. N36a TaxID=2767996 RepID=UPI001656FAB0|nr:hypothetical protein [Pedobacter sp. N36a]MBC8988107.1 hypothetical protein [Pedobacter sp. N36a]